MPALRAVIYCIDEARASKASTGEVIKRRISMNLRKHFTMGLALTGLVLGLVAVPASAEPVLKGSFELPVAAYWGDTLLPAGQYNISMSAELRDIASVP